MGNRCSTCGNENVTIFGRCSKHLTDKDRLESIGKVDEDIMTYFEKILEEVAPPSISTRLLEGQTYNQYINLKSRISKPRVILILPLHQIETNRLDDIVTEYLTMFFHSPVVLLKDYDLASLNIDAKLDTELIKSGLAINGYPMYEVNKIKDKIVKKNKPESILIAITEEHDISLNNEPTYGHLYHEEKIAIFSSLRLGLNNIEKLCKLITRAICHMIGMDHCVFFSCLLNDNDSYPMELCPCCLNKLYFTFDLHLEKRKFLLDNFFGKYKIKERRLTGPMLSL